LCGLIKQTQSIKFETDLQTNSTKDRIVTSICNRENQTGIKATLHAVYRDNIHYYWHQGVTKVLDITLPNQGRKTILMPSSAFA
jgi:hypothetical protein